jgi:hypothetical protein
MDDVLTGAFRRRVGSNRCNIEEETAGETLCHGEDVHQHRLMGRDATVFHVLAAFEDRIHAGKVLDAIILTNRGKATEAPIGIVTVSDVPTMVTP